VEVVVAAYGPSWVATYGPGVFEGPGFDAEGDGVSWANRQKVALEVDPTHTLAAAIDRAAADLGVRVTPQGAARRGPAEPVSEVISGVAFYKESDDLAGAHVGPWLSAFASVNAEGRLSWKWIREAEYGDLVRAYEQALLPGDPRRPYLWPVAPQGGEVLFGSWPDLVDVVGVVLRAAEAMAAVYGAAELIGAVRRRLQRARGIDHERLEAQNAGPAQVQELLKFRRPSATELENYFALTHDEAVDLLTAFGLDVGDDGRTVVLDSLDATFERRLFQVAIRSSEGFRPEGETLEAFARARLEALAAHEEDESEANWARAWHEATEQAHGLPPGLDVPPPDEEDQAERLAFRVISVRTDEGIDPAHVEQLLNDAAEDGFYVVQTLFDQALSDGSRGHLFVLARPMSADE